MKQLKSRLKALEDSGEAAHREEQVKEQQEICRKITQQRQMQEQAVRDGRMLLAACEKSGEELKRKLQESMGSLPRELERQMAKLVSLIQKREELREEKQRRDQEAIRFKQDYEEAYHAFLEEQAGLLARDLQEGQPCPVCGSCITPTRLVCQRQRRISSRWNGKKKENRSSLAAKAGQPPAHLPGMYCRKRKRTCSAAHQECAGQIGRGEGRLEQLKGQESQEEEKRRQARKRNLQKRWSRSACPWSSTGKSENRRTRLESGKKCWKFTGKTVSGQMKLTARCREMIDGKRKTDTTKAREEARADKRKEAAAGRKKPPSFCPLSGKTGRLPGR